MTTFILVEICTIVITKIYLKMSKILITGNGFDLYHNLPTKYFHFISVIKYLKGNSQNNFTFKNLRLIIEEIETSNFKNTITEDFELLNTSEINSINSKSEVNIWFNYFENILNSPETTWIDFETEIGLAINSVSKSFLIIDEFINVPSFQDYISTSSTDKFSLKSKDLHSKLSTFKFLTRFFQNQQLINPEYINKSNGHKTINKTKFLEDLYNSLEDFIEIFNLYLIHIVEKLMPYINNQFQYSLNTFEKIYTFNYTNTLEKLYNIDLIKIDYLHGRIDTITNTMVLGINDISNDLKSIKTFEFTKYFQKLHKNTDYHFFDDKSSQFYEFYIIGHSLDQSDEVYIKKMINYIKKNRYSAICVFYLNISDKANKLKNLLKIADSMDDQSLIEELMKSKKIIFEELKTSSVENKIQTGIAINSDIYI